MEPIISPHSRLRYPEHFAIGQGSILDDFCYISTRVRIGIGSHIASGCAIAGGVAHLFTLGDFSSLSSGVKVWCSSNDYVRDLICINHGVDLGDEPIEGNVSLGNYTGVGSNAVIMPDNVIPEGVAIGALSFVPPRFPFEPWTVYAGIPIRHVAYRDRARVLAQVARMRAASLVAR